MDATPDTLPFAERLRSTYEAAGGNQAEKVKIIVILREPASRELSLYNHLAFDCRNLDASERTEWHEQVMDEDGSILTFEDFVAIRWIPALKAKTGPGQSTRHSFYAAPLRKWFEAFDRKQILVLSYDKLQQQPGKLQERIRSFLGRSIPGRLKRSNANDNTHKLLTPCLKAKQKLDYQISLLLSTHNCTNFWSPFQALPWNNAPFQGLKFPPARKYEN